MTATQTGLRVAKVMNALQVIRFAIEAIVGSPEKTEVNQARASMAQKYIKAIEQQVRILGEQAKETEKR